MDGREKDVVKGEAIISISPDEIGLRVPTKEPNFDTPLVKPYLQGVQSAVAWLTDEEWQQVKRYRDETG